MRKISDCFQKIVSKIFIGYIEFVYKTSKIIKTGSYDFIKSTHDEKFIVCFWHGDSYCFYPFSKNEQQYIITTEDSRGNYISMMCDYFGYTPIRVPDKSIGGNFLFKINKTINGENKGNLAITLDGPLGPYHEPKIFAFMTATVTKRRILPISVDVKNKIQLKKRWDNYIIPLPFNKIEIHVHEPIKINKTDLKNKFEVKRKNLKNEMENHFI